MRHEGIWPGSSGHSASSGSFTGKQWMLLAVGAAITVALSMGVHDLAITKIGIPYPDEKGVPALARFVRYAGSIGAVLLFCLSAHRFFGSRRFITSFAVLAALLLAFNEITRTVVIDWVVSNGWFGTNSLYILTKHAPRVLGYLYQAAAILLIVRFARPKGGLAMLCALLIVAAIGYQLRAPFGWLANAVRAGQDVATPIDVYQPPFPIYVYLYIYGMFIEPVAATIVMAAMCWPCLADRNGRQLLMFSGLVLLMRGDLVTTFVYPLWSKGSWVSATVSEAQFFAESLLLGLLSALTWKIATSYRMTVSHISSG